MHVASAALADEPERTGRAPQARAAAASTASDEAQRGDIGVLPGDVADQPGIDPVRS
ncbi:hypothetical protein AMYX_18000 [Anaeromyxobacter diazotrophicus]|uniref:Uncharacterized protein n=1 Tax=Anaeromyxobacter diazotrophicus TaxID=2590199 RepID=A0A7I9VLS1_9BACT|nr:hypothetical protein AMYX_18000 [Anaeromyxobacter diazotrophicus]